MIKAVIFDLGSVLVTDNWPVIYKKISEEINTSVEKTKKIVNSLFERLAIDKIDEQTLWKEIERQTGIKLPGEFKNDFWFNAYKEWVKDINPSWDILNELHGKGIRLAILANIIKTSLLANKGLGRLQRFKDAGVEAFIGSCEEGFKKPDPEIYKITLKRLNLPPEDCVFVDDKEVNVEAANKLGIHGIVFKTPEQLRKDLINLGLLQ